MDKLVCPCKRVKRNFQVKRRIEKKAIIFIAIFGIISFISDTSYPLEKNDIDVVLVMDSSGSMKKTDPLTLRIPAAKLFISLLDKNDRTGVISFRDKGYPIIYLTHVDSEINKDRLLKATDMISSKGLYTNLYDAFTKGLEVLSKDKRPGRAQIIILMSDGMMDVGNPDEDRILVDRLKNELIEILKDNDVKVYTIAFTELSDRQLLEEISKKTGGFYNLALTDKDFHLIFTSIFESLKAPEMLPLDENKFFVDKSIEEVIIVATKGSPDTRIYLGSPDGKKYSSKERSNDIRWFVSYNFDMITIKKPVEGRWEILFSAGRDNKAYIITNLKLLTNLVQLYPPLSKPIDIKVWLEKDGSILKEREILERFDIYIEVSRPDGETIKLALFNKGEKGEGIFTSQLVPDKPGSYRLRIVAKGKTFERERGFVFHVINPVKEKQEGIKTPQSEKKTETPLGQNSAIDEKTDELLWKTALIKLILINLIFCIIIFAYLKRRNLRGLIQSLIKRRK
ncbi:MAG: VWA domain-containing protein [Nitrospinota bacterium]